MPHTPEPSITAYRDGPFLVRGPVVLLDEDGRELTIRRRVVPLCRCGRSRTKPLCDGAHEVKASRGGGATKA
ncbi:MAG: CDGSH iron-sulfur domain-containing protein [Actinomycetota bacterium]